MHGFDGKEGIGRCGTGSKARVGGEQLRHGRGSCLARALCFALIALSSLDSQQVDTALDTRPCLLGQRALHTAPWPRPRRHRRPDHPRCCVRIFFTHPRRSTTDRLWTWTCSKCTPIPPWHPTPFTPQPTFVYYKGGRRVESFSGARPDMLEDLIKKHSK